ncbi:hypothetical protein CR513_20989, partial [Mucuna pruriens]
YLIGKIVVLVQDLRIEKKGRENKEGLDLVKKDTQSINVMVEALSKKEEPRVILCMKVNEAFDESGSSRYYRRRPRITHKRREMDGMKVKIPYFPRESNLNLYLD